MISGNWVRTTWPEPGVLADQNHVAVQILRAIRDEKQQMLLEKLE